MIISFVNKFYLTSSFPICIPFISFSYLIALTWASGMMLERGDQRGILAVLLALVGKLPYFSLLNMMLACGIFHEVEEGHFCC